MGRIRREVDSRRIEQCKRDLVSALQQFQNGWHACLDRTGACTEKAQNCALFSWYTWCLNDKDVHNRLQTAICETRELLTGGQQRISHGFGTDRDIHSFFLLEFLDALGDWVPCSSSRKTAEHEELHDKIARFVLGLLWEAPKTPEVIEATILAVSQYAYRVLGVDPRLHLASHMRHQARGEPSLHMMKEFYRDHFFHTIDVCFLGHILAKTRGEQKGLEPPFPSDQEFLREWYIAALLHDAGYAVDICKGLKEWLAFFTSDSFGTLENGIGDALTGVKKATETFAGKYGFPNLEELREDHGLVGAHHLQGLVEDLKTNGGVHDTDRAIGAIAKHNCHNVKIDYNKEPMAALLVLCDTLQSWHRPQFPHFSQGPAWMMSAMGSSGVHRQPEVASATLLSNLRLVKQDQDLIPQFEEPLVFRLRYGPEVNRDSYVFNIWLDTTCNLQRVDFTELPYDILVQIDTPVYPQLGSNRPRRQMDRLRDAAWETHMAYLANWWPKSADNPDKIPDINTPADLACCRANQMCYHVTSDPITRIPQREMLSFSLRKMAGQRNLMTETLSRFRKDLRNWKHYGDDRVFLDDYSPWKPKIR